MVNFGCPRVGNRSFAEAFEKAVDESWRYVSYGDPITNVPKLHQYSHVNVQQMIYPDGVEVNSTNESEFEREKEANIIDIWKHTRIDELGQAVFAYSSEIIRRFMDGSGFDEHMRENYFDCLFRSFFPDRPLSTDE